MGIDVVQRELVEKKRWLTLEEFVEDWAVAQIMPGPNVVNLAVMLGDRYFGWRGAVAALSGILVAPFFIVLGLAALYVDFARLPVAVGAMHGMSAVAAGLVQGLAAGEDERRARHQLHPRRDEPVLLEAHDLAVFARHDEPRARGARRGHRGQIGHGVEPHRARKIIDDGAVLQGDVRAYSSLASAILC